MSGDVGVTPLNVTSKQGTRIALAIFYVGIPIAQAVWLGSQANGSGRFVWRGTYYLYDLSGSLMSWPLLWIGTWIVAWALRPWRAPLALVTALAVVLVLQVSAPLAMMRHHLFEPYLQPGSHFFPILPWRYDQPRYLLEAVMAWLTTGALWTGANVFYLWFLRIPRFGFQPPLLKLGAAAASFGPPPPAMASPLSTGLPAGVLVERLPPSIGAHIVAMRAEEHYTRIYGRDENVLIRVRFSEAVKALAGTPGVQVHRSYWVRVDSLSAVDRVNGGYRLTLVNGVQVPVSRSFKQKLEETVALVPYQSPPHLVATANLSR